MHNINIILLINNFFIKLIKLIFHLKMEFNHLIIISSFLLFILTNTVTCKIYVRTPEKLSSIFTSKQIFNYKK